MKKITFAAAMIAISLITMTGCSRKEEAEWETIITEEFTETAEIETTGMDDEMYLDWKISDLLKVDKEEQLKAMTAYSMYLAELKGIEQSADSFENVSNQMEILWDRMSGILQDEEMQEVTLRQMADSLEVDNVISISEIVLGEYERYLEYTYEDWEKATDDERKQVGIAYAMILAQLNDIDVAIETLEESGIEMDTYINLLDTAFGEMKGTKLTLGDVIKIGLTQ